MEHLTSWSYNPRIAETILVWAVPISLAATIGIINYFLFLRVLRCFSSPGLLLSVTGLQPAGLPHSEIYGSKVMCTSPQLITSFIASASQGIRRLPLITFLIRLLYMFIPICQRTNLIPITNYKDPCGEYRSRTDDLLRARQAL